MKYNTLLAFRAHLAGELSPSTAITYYKAIDFLLKDQPLLDCRNFDVHAVVIKLKAMKYKNQYSKYRNAFIKFCDYLNIELSDKILLDLELMKTEKIKKYRKLKPVNLKDIKNHIKVIRDKRLKLSFETMLYSGLRVSELSQIRKEDCIVGKDTITLHFIGKGGKRETVIINDRRVVARLKNLIQSTRDEKKVFYTSSYLQMKAHEKGFQCHDLRRAFAKLAYKEYKDISKVMELLRHSKIKTTKIYLRSKLKI